MRFRSVTNPTISDVAKLMQSTAFDVAQWQPALDALNAFVGGTGAVLLSIEARLKFAPMSCDMGEMMEDYIHRGWHANDKREACVPLLKQRGIVFDHDFQRIEDIENDEYYHDFLARHRRKWFAGVGVEIDGDHWCLALQRSPERGAFTAADRGRLELVRGVLASTARLSNQVGQSWMFGLQHALDVMMQPALVFDSRGKILHANEAAQKIVGGFIDRDRMLRLPGGATAAFDQMLAEALLSVGSPTRVLHVGHASYRCRATSLLGNERLMTHRAAALVVLTPIEPSPDRRMKERYGLTDAEVRVSMAIADGRSVKEIAAAAGVKVGTVRSQLKSVYSKTDTGRQAQLVAFVRNLVPGARG